MNRLQRVVDRVCAAYRPIQMVKPWTDAYGNPVEPIQQPLRRRPDYGDVEMEIGKRMKESATKRMAFQRNDVCFVNMNVIRQEIPLHGGPQWYKNLRRAIMRGWGLVKIWDMKNGEAEVIANYPLGIVDGSILVPLRALKLAKEKTKAAFMPMMTLRVGDLVDAGIYGEVYVTALGSSTIWVSKNEKDIERRMGQPLRRDQVRRVIKMASIMDVVLCLADDEYVPRSVVAQICSACAEKMERQGIKAVRASVIKKAFANSRKRKAAYQSGKGQIKFKIGDLVRIGTRRNVWKITDVRIEYAVYDDVRNFAASFPHESLGRLYEPIGWTPIDPNRIGVEKDGYGAVGDTVRVLRTLSRAIAGHTYTIGLIHENYNGEGVNTNRPLIHVEPQALEPADAEPTDSQGRAAYEAFLADYGKPGDNVIQSRGRGEDLGRIMAITSNGRVKVGIFGVGEWITQEQYKPDISKVVEIRIFVPLLVHGSWMWSSEKHYFLRRYKGERQMQVLLD